MQISYVNVLFLLASIELDGLFGRMVFLYFCYKRVSYITGNFLVILNPPILLVSSYKAD